MKLIEAMKRVKMNKEKITDLQQKINASASNLSHETPVYGPETFDRIKEWLQSCTDLTQENVRLLVAIQRTNLQTLVKIDINGKVLEKSIAEWVWRRREYAALDFQTYKALNDRGLKEGFMNQSTGQTMEIKIVRNYDPNVRDEKLSEYKSEPTLIDGSLEIINAVTDLVE